MLSSAGKRGFRIFDGTTKANSGLTGYAYTYQWDRVDADGTSFGLNVAGAIEPTYTVLAADVAKKIRVLVSFE